MPKDLLNIIQEYSRKTDNKCGLTAVQLSGLSGIPFQELKAVLNDMYKEGLIRVRDGVHGKLIFAR